MTDWRGYPYIQFDYRLKHPSTCYVYGPTKSGKTSFIHRMLLDQERVFQQPFRHIHYVYGVDQPIYKEMKRNFKGGITFHHINEVSFKDLLKSLENCILILDDCIYDVLSDETVIRIYTREANNRNFTVMLLSQYALAQGKYARQIITNSGYHLLFKNCRDFASIQRIATQMYGTGSPDAKLMLSAYRDISKQDFQPLLTDCTANVPVGLHLRTNLLGDHQLVYLPSS
jgi:GTPase SAR1 family protein